MPVNQNKRSPNNGILLKGVLIPKLLNNPSASCSFINIDFLLPYTAQFYDKANQPFLVFTIFASLFFVFFLHFKQFVCFYDITDHFFIMLFFLITLFVCFLQFKQ